MRQGDCEVYVAELTLMGTVNEKNEAEVTRLIRQQRERDEAAAAAAGECIRLKHAAERAAADREAAVAAQQRSERAAILLQERISALEVQLQARACPTSGGIACIMCVPSGLCVDCKCFCSAWPARYSACISGLCCNALLTHLLAAGGEVAEAPLCGRPAQPPNLHA